MSQITATVIADSVNEYGDRLTTMVCEYPRFIHSEVMTHRVFSRNASSSRAIPIKTVIKQVLFDPAIPVHWGKNQRGMQAKEQLGGVRKFIARSLWRTAGVVACGFAYLMHLSGLHKQVANRILEPWQMMKVAISSTDWDNFFELRAHPDAQPEIQTLAVRIRTELEISVPTPLKSGEWHIPYDSEIDTALSQEERLRISVSAMAQVSYRKLDLSLAKANEIWDMLVNSKPVHASPLEHVAYAGVGSGNFVGFTQLRHTVMDDA